MAPKLSGEDPSMQAAQPSERKQRLEMTNSISRDALSGKCHSVEKRRPKR